MGICSDVCVPVKAEFELPVGTGKTDFAQDLRIRQAAAETPIAWDRETSPIGDPAIEPATGTLTFTIDPKLIDPGRLFATVEGAGLGFAPPQPIPGKPNGFAMKLLARPGMAAAAATAVRFTFVTARGPYEIVQPL
jgi:DsbC/DsbD-like thiol-disulfide interchange protein